MTCNPTTCSPASVIRSRISHPLRPAHRQWALLLCVGIALVLASGCGRNDEPAQGGRGSDRVVTVETTQVKEREWQLVARSVGSLAADEQVRIRNEVEGIVKALDADEGDWVELGDRLLKLDHERPSLEVLRAEARYHEAQTMVERLQPLFVSNLISEAEFIVAEAGLQAARAEASLARRRLADTDVRAPMAGQVGRRYVSPGEYAQAGSHLFDLVKFDVLKLDFELPERYLALIEEGQTVRIRSAAFPDETFSGEVYFINPVLNRSTRTIPVRARIQNPERVLRPNQFVEVELDVQRIEAAVVVPEEAIIADMGGFTVYVIDDDDRAEIRHVRLGEREPGWIQILDGVAPGERIVRVGHQRLQPGLRIQERDRSGE